MQSNWQLAVGSWQHMWLLQKVLEIKPFKVQLRVGVRIQVVEYYESCM